MLQVKINLLPGQIVDYVISGDDDYDSDFEDIPECIEVESEKVTTLNPEATLFAIIMFRLFANIFIAFSA